MNIHLAAILMLPRCQGLTCAHMYIVQEVAHFVVFWRSILDPHPYFLLASLLCLRNLQAQTGLVAVSFLNGAVIRGGNTVRFFNFVHLSNFLTCHNVA